MFPLEQGAFEMLLIGAIALIVVGPKDLPVLMRKLGQFTGRMRGMAAEFRASFDEMARQSELDELRKEVDALRTGAYTAPVSAEIDKHLYDYDQTPTHHPSPAPEPELFPIADGGGDPLQAGEAGSVAPPPHPSSAVPLPTGGADEVLAATIKKPRARKAAAPGDAPPKPRKPRAKPATPREVEG